VKTTSGDNGKGNVAAVIDSGYSEFVVSEDALQYRLALGATTAKGGRGTLARSAHNLLTSSADFVGKPEEKEEIVRELRILQIEMNKLFLLLERIKFETRQLADEHESPSFAGSHDTDTALFSSLSKQVSNLRRQVSTAQQAQSCQVEYEALAALLHRRHATSRHTLQSQVDSVQLQIESTARDLQQKRSTVQIRTSQIHGLLQAILDLKQSLLVSDVAVAAEQIESAFTPSGPATVAPGTANSANVYGAESTDIELETLEEGSKPIRVIDEGMKGTYLVAPSTTFLASTNLGPDETDLGDGDDEVEEGEEVDDRSQTNLVGQAQDEEDLYVDL
jgi:hypothetical protein